LKYKTTSIAGGFIFQLAENPSNRSCIIDKLKKRSRTCENIFRDAGQRILQSAEERARLAPANDDNEAG